MSKLRNSARGQPCFVRLPGICNHNPETTVLAHLGGAGMGLKHDDLFGAFACSDCHDQLDGRSKPAFKKDYLMLAHYQGMQRTQQWWLDNGMVKHD